MTEIKFPRDTSFRNLLFTPDSFAHPAKMDAQLLIWIVEKYTKVGETILDPMAGMGTTMLSCMLGRNCILVELEQKFVGMQKANWEKVKMMPQLGYQMGDCKILQGDARNLEGLMADNIITSPPYSDISMGGGLNTKPPREGRNDQTGRSSKSPSQEGAGHYVDGIITSPPYEGSVVPFEKDAGKRRAERLHSLGISEKDPDRGGLLRGIRAGNAYKGFSEGYSEDQNNIGNLKSDSYLSAMLQVYQQCHKVLKPSQKECGCGIISEEVKDGQALSSRVFRRGGLRGVDRQGGKVDSRTEVKRSPEPNQGLLGESGLPEHIPLQSEIQIPTTQRETSRRIQTTSSQLPRHQDNPERPDAILDGKKGRRNQNITGDRKETSAHGEAERGRCGDAEESRIVVNQDREVLPLLKQENTFNSSQGGGVVTKEICPKCGQAIRITGGLLILVTKNFIRDKKEVRLDKDTIKLCEQAGFQFVERHYRKLSAQSFWRVIYNMKYPDAPVLDKEDILVFRT